MALFGTLARNPDLPMPTRYLQAVAGAKAGDAAGYRAACAWMAERLPRGDPKRSHHDSNIAARAATLGPNATNDWTKTLSWTEHALTRLAEIEKARPNLKDLILRERHRFLNTRGAVLYRAGRLRKRPSAPGGNARPPRRGRVPQRIVPCPRRSRLGHADAALEAAAKAKRRLGPKPASVWDQAEMELLAAELNAGMPLPQSKHRHRDSYRRRGTTLNRRTDYPPRANCMIRREYGCISIRSRRAQPHPPSWVAVGAICFRGRSGGDDRQLLGQRPVPLLIHFREQRCCGFTSPSKANELAFQRAVEEVTASARALFGRWSPRLSRATARSSPRNYRPVRRRFGPKQ